MNISKGEECCNIHKAFKDAVISIINNGIWELGKKELNCKNPTPKQIKVESVKITEKDIYINNISAKYGKNYYFLSYNETQNFINKHKRLCANPNCGNLFNGGANKKTCSIDCRKALHLLNKGGHQ
jgi:hypothetical protein